jgi:hypothetical protein
MRSAHPNLDRELTCNSLPTDTEMVHIYLNSVSPGMRRALSIEKSVLLYTSNLLADLVVYKKSNASPVSLAFADAIVQSPGVLKDGSPFKGTALYPNALLAKYVEKGDLLSQDVQKLLKEDLGACSEEIFNILSDSRPVINVYTGRPSAARTRFLTLAIWLKAPEKYVSRCDTVAFREFYPQDRSAPKGVCI